jgi:hypothetical protein
MNPTSGNYAWQKETTNRYWVGVAGRRLSPAAAEVAK